MDVIVAAMLLLCPGLALAGWAMLSRARRVVR